MSERKRLLSVKNVKKYFTVREANGNTHVLKAVDQVSCDISMGEIVGVVGESGCGKSTLAKTIMRVYEPDEGKIYWKQKDFTILKGSELKQSRKNIQMVFQDPFSSLNPRKNVEAIIGQPLRIHNWASVQDRKQRVQEVLNEVGINPAYMHRYPHQFSGGQRQRIGIARALVLHPEFVICDEAVSALDVSIQAQILNLLLDLRDQYGFAIFFISHDLSVVEFIANHVLVMYLGRVVESAPKQELMKQALHPYSRALLEASPGVDLSFRKKRSFMVMGDVPSPVHLPTGCYFHPRCPLATERCRKEYPPLFSANNNRKVACWEADHL